MARVGNNTVVIILDTKPKRWNGNKDRRSKVPASWFADITV